MGLGLPIINAKMTKDILNLGRDLGLGRIADKTVHGSPATDDITEGAGKLTISFHSIDITELGMETSKELCTSGTIVNGRSVTIDGISSDRFIMAANVESRERSTEGVIDMTSNPTRVGVLGSGFKCLTNGFNR